MSSVLIERIVICGAEKDFWVILLIGKLTVDRFWKWIGQLHAIVQGSPKCTCNAFPLFEQPSSLSSL